MSTVESELESLYEDEEGLFARDINGHLIRMDKVTADDLEEEITLVIDGQSVTVNKAVPKTDSVGNILHDENGLIIPRATTIYDAASKLYKDRPGGNPIPVLCHRDYMEPVAVCRLCVVEIAKEKRGKVQVMRKLLPACQHRVEKTMIVSTVNSPDKEAVGRIETAITPLIELLMADHPTPCKKEQIANETRKRIAAEKAAGAKLAEETRVAGCELETLARQFHVGASPYPKRAESRGRDDSSIVIAVDHDACVLCDRCIRGCNDIRDNQVLGRRNKGYKSMIAFDLGDEMGSSSCVACGECMFSCPTGALTFRKPVEADPFEGTTPEPEAVKPYELFNHKNPDIRKAFAGVAPSFMGFNKDALVRRRFKPGQVICREGEYGSTAFLIEDGSVEVCIRTPNSHVKNKAGGGLFKRFTSILSSGKEDDPERQRSRVSIPTGDAVSLSVGRPVATMGPGDLFGEMTCMSFYPRSATVVAGKDGAVVFEMLRNVLYIMQRSPAYREVLEQKYRDRVLGSHLRSVSLFEPLRENEAEFDKLLEELKDKVRLRRCEPGEVIFRQGAAADDGFYIVRAGFVKVSQSRQQDEIVLDYVGPGGYFGEIGLLSDLPEFQGLTEPGVRNATCTALDHVDLVRITARDFRDITDRFPEKFRSKLVEQAVSILTKNKERTGQGRSESLDAFVSQGLYNATSLLVLDLEKCTRCDECTKACSDAHSGVTRLIREGLRFDKFLVASSCRSCLDPYCMVGCPVGAIRRRNSQEIIIEDWCIGCGKCAENCPYGNINMHAFETHEDVPGGSGKVAVMRQKATSCDLCHDLGKNAEPSCVYACPHDAAHPRMKGVDLYDIVVKAQAF
ncbi:MAG: cyclic nucleotide-binding domain-containing protein [Isosphaeraceae bacterium]